MLITRPNINESNGHDLIKKIRESNKPYKNIPIIVTSTDDSIETITKSYELGAISYLVEPYSVNELEAIVNRFYGTETIPRKS